jgi:ABC-2 type transport system permease protein
MVLPRYDWQRLFRRRLVVLLIMAAMIWPLLCAVFIYLSNNSELLFGMDSQFKEFIKADGGFFLIFMNVQAAFAIFLAALAGPGLIAPDLANNALQIYFSRPLARTDYLLARLATLLGMLSLITWVPGLCLFGMQVGMSSEPWLAENWRIGWAIFAGFSIWILLLSLVALASSAYARIRVIAGAIVLGFFFVLSGASAIINAVLRATWGHALNPGWATRRLWQAMLDIEPPAGPGAAECALVLAAMMLVLVFVLERKLRPVEIVT